MEAMKPREERAQSLTQPGSIPSFIGLHQGTRYTRQRRRGLPPRWGGYTAFVLSGGGARGALQVGALRALMEHGERPDVVVGTSIGAWNGAWLARTPTLEAVRELTEVWKTIHAGQVLLGRDLPANYPQHALNGMLMFNAARRMLGGKASLYSNVGTRQLLSRHFGDLTFDDLTVPFRVVATDLTHGCRAVLSEGGLVEAILASSSVPGIFPPIVIGETTYGDGGTLDCCSLETALDLGARRLFLLAIGHDTDTDGGALWCGERVLDGDAFRQAAGPAMAVVLERCGQVLNRYQLERALERLPRGIETHVICLSTGNGCGMLDFTHIAEWIEQGYEKTRAYLRSHLPGVREDELAAERARDEASVAELAGAVG
jgi:NTE family protein